MLVTYHMWDNVSSKQSSINTRISWLTLYTRTLEGTTTNNRADMYHTGKKCVLLLRGWTVQISCFFCSTLSELITWWQLWVAFSPISHLFIIFLTLLNKSSLCDDLNTFSSNSPPQRKSNIYQRGCRLLISVYKTPECTEARAPPHLWARKRKRTKRNTIVPPQHVRQWQDEDVIVLFNKEKINTAAHWPHSWSHYLLINMCESKTGKCMKSHEDSGFVH